MFFEHKFGFLDFIGCYMLRPFAHFARCCVLLGVTAQIL